MKLILFILSHSIYFFPIYSSHVFIITPTASVPPVNLIRTDAKLASPVAVILIIILT